MSTARPRHDPRVYRADVDGIKHPDATFIAAIANAAGDLIAAAEAVERVSAAVEDTPPSHGTEDYRAGFEDAMRVVRIALGGDSQTAEQALVREAVRLSATTEGADR